MEINTKYLGKINIDQSSIISFPNGLLGLKDSKNFAIINMEDMPQFRFLQDIENENISFLVINPWEFFPDYDIELPDEKLGNININPKGENLMEIYTIVTLSKEFKKSTSNLLAPVVINVKEKKGKQFVLNNSPYTTKHPLFKEGV